MGAHTAPTAQHSIQLSWRQCFQPILQDWLFCLKIVELGLFIYLATNVETNSCFFPQSYCRTWAAFVTLQENQLRGERIKLHFLQERALTSGGPLLCPIDSSFFKVCAALGTTSNPSITCCLTPPTLGQLLASVCGQCHSPVDAPDISTMGKIPLERQKSCWEVARRLMALSHVTSTWPGKCFA